MSDDTMTEWLSHFSPERPAADPRIHRKAPFPVPEVVRAAHVAICTGDLGPHIRVISGDDVPPPRAHVWRRWKARTG